MTHWETVHTDEVEGFDIRLDVTSEDERPEQDTLDKINNGLLLWFCARVTVSRDGLDLGDDVLGGCCYESIADFLKPGGYYSDMVQQAIEQARGAIEKLCKCPEASE